MTSNIDRFNEVTAGIFARLYESFPQRIEIDYADLVEEDEDGGVDKEALGFVRDTASWLQDAGYIDGKLGHQGMMMAVLKPKGLEALKATPAQISGENSTKSVGDALVESLRQGALDTARGLVPKALTALAVMMGGG